jgi:hypothetical protein
MILIGQAVLLASEIDPTLNPNNPRIGWHSILTDDNVDADSAAEGFPADNLAVPNTYQKWVSESLDAQYVTVELEASEDADYFALAGHNFGSGQITFQLQGTLDEEAPKTWDDLTDEVAVVDDRPIMYHFGTQNYLAFRLRLVPEGATPPRAAVLYIGRILTLQRRVYVGHSPAALSREITTTTGRSENGQFLGRIERRRSFVTTAQFSNLTPAWYRLRFDPFVAAASVSTPFFWAWRPGTYPEDTQFAWLTETPQPTNQRNNGMMSVSLSMQALL